MADKTVWICGGEKSWAVRMDGYLLEADLTLEMALKRAGRMAAFLEEDGQSVELKVMKADGGWRTLSRKPHFMAQGRRWFGGMQLSA